MRTLQLLTLLALIFYVLPSAHGQKATCSCSSQTASSQLSSARHIFLGEIQEAEVDSKGEFIQLRIQVLESYRGMTKPVHETSTALPDNCGIKATPGSRSVFILKDDVSPLSVCHVPPRATGFQSHDLQQALITSVFYNSNRDRVNALLKTVTRYNRNRENLERSFFAPLNLVDPDGLNFSSTDVVTYRDHQFVFKGEKLLSILEP